MSDEFAALPRECPECDANLDTEARCPDCGWEADVYVITYKDPDEEDDDE